MRTDLAFLTGFLDRDATHPRFIHAHADAEAEGIVMETIYTDDLPGFQRRWRRLFSAVKAAER